MNRRAFLGTLSAGLLTAPLAAEAQQAGKGPRVGIAFSGAPVSTMLGPDPSNRAMKGLLQGLRSLGYTDGQNIILERRSAEGQYERLSDIMAEFIRLKVDLIIAGGNPATAAAKKATTTIPVVAGGLSYPVEAGLIASLARPGGNITGLAYFSDLNAKQLEIVNHIVPKGSTVAVLRYAPDPIHATIWKATQVASHQLGVELQSIEIHAPDELESVFALMAKGPARAVMILPGAPFFVESNRIARLATRHRLLGISEFREFAEAGGLLSYGTNVSDMWWRVASFVDRILRRTKPADLPVEQPTKYELVINLGTAKALGLTIPPSLLQRADQVIE